MSLTSVGFLSFVVSIVDHTILRTDNRSYDPFSTDGSYTEYLLDSQISVSHTPVEVRMITIEILTFNMA